MVMMASCYNGGATAMTRNSYRNARIARISGAANYLSMNPVSSAARSARLDRFAATTAPLPAVTSGFAGFQPAVGNATGSNYVNEGRINYLADIQVGARELSAALQSLSAGSESIEEGAVIRVADSFNSLLATAMVNTNNLQLRNDLVSVASSYAQRLGRVGVAVDRQGFMATNENVLSAAAQDNALTRIFAPYENRSLGITNRLMNIAESVQRNPARYVAGAPKERPKIDLQNPTKDDLQWLAGQRNQNAAKLGTLDLSAAVGRLFNVYV